MTISPTVVSLFSGCGGLDLGFKDQGFDLLYACDSDPAAVACYARNVDHRVHRRDVRSEEFHREIASLGKCDVVLGGFPCQGFSKAGPKDDRDPRNSLYLEMQRAVAQLQPLVFLAENVDGLHQNFGGQYLYQIIKDFRNIGYAVDHRILQAASYGLPQYRRRVVFIGMRQDLGCGFRWPQETHAANARNGEFRLAHSPTETLLWQEAEPAGTPQALKPHKTIGQAIGDLLELDDSVPDHRITNAWPDKYRHIFRAIKEGQKLCNVRHSQTSVYSWQIPEVFGHVTKRERLILETVSKNRRHKEYGNIPNGNPLAADEISLLSGIENIDGEVSSLVRKRYLKVKHGKYDLQGAMFCSGLFKRPMWDDASPTVLTVFHSPRYFLHPLRDRPFSLRECARLQGFPDAFIFTSRSERSELVDAYRLVGNAVPPLLAGILAASVKELLVKAAVATG
jgi:DNA (cytosine-5)-methyltransferase 1